MSYSIVFAGLFVLRTLLEMIVKPRPMGSTLQGKKRGLVSLLLLVISFYVSGFAVTYFLFTEAAVSMFPYLGGALLFCAGFAGRVVSLREIGAGYSQYIDCVSGSRLVTTGIYSYVRHPLYFFYIVEMLGFLLIKHNYISLLASGIVIVTTIYRIRAEEVSLMDRYKDEYSAYRNRTRCLIPFVV